MGAAEYKKQTFSALVLCAMWGKVSDMLWQYVLWGPGSSPGATILLTSTVKRSLNYSSCHYFRQPICSYLPQAVIGSLGVDFIAKP